MPRYESYILHRYCLESYLIMPTDIYSVLQCSCLGHPPTFETGIIVNFSISTTDSAVWKVEGNQKQLTCLATSRRPPVPMRILVLILSLPWKWNASMPWNPTTLRSPTGVLMAKATTWSVSLMRTMAPKLKSHVDTRYDGKNKSLAFIFLFQEIS